MKLIARISSTTSISFLLAAAALAGLIATAPAVAGDPAAGTTYVVGVDGMICPSGCTASVQEALETVEGVQTVDVSYKNKNATVAMAPGKTLTADRCDQALGNSGYFVSSFDEVKAAGSGQEG